MRNAGNDGAPQRPHTPATCERDDSHDLVWSTRVGGNSAALFMEARKLYFGSAMFACTTATPTTHIGEVPLPTSLLHIRMPSLYMCPLGAMIVVTISVSPEHTYVCSENSWLPRVRCRPNRNA